MSETGAGMPYQPPQKKAAPRTGPAGPKDDQPGHGIGNGTGGGAGPVRTGVGPNDPAPVQSGGPQRAAAPGQTPAPYGTGDNRRQYGTMPMRGAVGTPPGMGQGRGGYQPPSYGPPGSGSAGMPNTPGGGMASGLSQPGGRVPDEVRRRMETLRGQRMGPNGDWQGPTPPPLGLQRDRYVAYGGPAEPPRPDNGAQFKPLPAPYETYPGDPRRGGGNTGGSGWGGGISV